MVQLGDVVVIGGGHAGCEAAWACARLGLRTVLVTMDPDRIAQMSCNPAIGGIAKGHLVREIDALGGIMAEVTDAAGIQFRLLNTSRGPAVWSPRAQCDKKRYRLEMRARLDQEPLLRILGGEVAALRFAAAGTQRRVTSVTLTDGTQLDAGAVIITTGTFLNGLAHVGEDTHGCGRTGEPPSVPLGGQLRTLGLQWRRLKTGTPPRLDGPTIRWSELEEQPGDAKPTPFSFLTERITQPQVSCHLTYTTAETHRILRDNLHRSPLYSGRIEGIGPRYCPSVEDKVVRFADKLRHQVYLEPEGLDTDEIYVNGLSTSMPADVQAAMIASVPGLEAARIVRYGYAIEYDTIDPRELDATLQVKTIGGLFLAGQINGTSGYEEAASQGLLAGINAARLLGQQEPVILNRDQAYLGILIDDLTSRGTDEPYRMFTSRAEFRLQLRIDNADERLTPLAVSVGLATAERQRLFARKREQRDRARLVLERARLSPRQFTDLPAVQDHPTALEWLRRPEGSLTLLSSWLEEQLGEPLAHGVVGALETEIKYSGYVRQQERQVERLRAAERRTIPASFSYTDVPGLTREVREKLGRVQPRTLGQASRIPGVTPAAVAILDVYLDLAGARA